MASDHVTRPHGGARSKILHANDLLRGISTQARYLGEPLHRIMMFSEEVRRRACLVASFRVASYRRFHRRINDAQLFGQTRTLRVKQLLGLNGSTGSLRSRRSQRRYSDARPFSSHFAG
jgi:hypothetical protein